mgnify:FL=1
MLSGGNDAYNMLIPAESAEYAAYRKHRANLALDRDALLPLVDNTRGRHFGLHPQMAEVASLYAAKEAALIANVGTLVEPFEADRVWSGRAQIPPDLFSHRAQRQQWQTGCSQAVTNNGWGSRAIDCLQHVNESIASTRNISASGPNIFQAGGSATSQLIPPVRGTRSRPSLSANDAFDCLEADPYCDYFEAHHPPSHGAGPRVKPSIEGVTGEHLGEIFSDSPFSRVLCGVANTIESQLQLPAARQIFYVRFNGWDHHIDLLADHAAMLSHLSRGLGEFRTAMVKLGVFDNVTAFTMSDFGRALSSNGSGSDHGWGGHHIVVGGSVRGGRVFGRYPSLDPSNPLHLGQGVFAPSLSTDEYFADLALWLGVPHGHITSLLPNLKSFYSTTTKRAPVGFLA